MVILLDDDIWFPSPYGGDPDGLIAYGGDLKIDRLLLAYSNGIFPWFSFRDSDIMWWCPLDRFVIFPNKIHISHSMRTLINKGTYSITLNNDFKGVIENCSRANNRYDQPGAWLGKKMIEAYTELYNQGFAASIEVYEGDELVGGLYGVNIGKCFIGESMFSLRPNASKLALIYLAQVLELNGGLLIDCQLETPHLRSMGGEHITYEEYMKYLNA